MKKTSKLAAIVSVLLSVWGMVDIYHYFSVGKGILLYYDGVDVINELINYNLAQGILKILLGCCLFLAFLIRNRSRK